MAISRFGYLGKDASQGWHAAESRERRGVDCDEPRRFGSLARVGAVGEKNSAVEIRSRWGSQRRPMQEFRKQQATQNFLVSVCERLEWLVDRREVLMYRYSQGGVRTRTRVRQHGIHAKLLISARGIAIMTNARSCGDLGATRRANAILEG